MANEKPTGSAKAGGNRNAEAAFEKSFQTRTKGAWAGAKKQQADRQLNVPDGTYLAQLTRAIVGQTKAGDPYVIFRFSLIDENEEYDGQSGSKGHFLLPQKPGKNRQGKPYQSMEDKLANLAKDFQRLGFDTTEDDAMTTPQEITSACKKLTKDKPFIKVAVQARKDDKGKPDPTQEPNIYINGLARPEEIPDEDADDDAGEDNENDTEDEDDAPVTSSRGGSGKKRPPVADEEEAGDDDGEEEAEEEEAEDDDTPPPKKKRNAKKEEEPSDDYDEDEESDDDAAGESEDEEVEEEEDDTPPPKKTGGGVKVGSKVKYKGSLYTVDSLKAGKASLKSKAGKVLRNISASDLSLVK